MCQTLVVASCVLTGCQVDVWLGDPWATGDTDAQGGSPSLEQAPCLRAVPSLVDFGMVTEGQRGERPLSLRNTCASPVTVTGFLLSGSPALQVVAEGVSWSSGPVTAIDGVTFQAPVEIGGGQEAPIQLAFEPAKPDGAVANVVWLSDDPYGGYGLAVQLKGNTATPCVVTFPKAMDFGGALIEDTSQRELLVKSCGGTPLNVHSLSVTGASASRFEISSDGGVSETPLEPGEVRTVAMTFNPEGVATRSDDGTPLRERAVLVLETDTFHGEMRVDLEGFGADHPCPHAIIAPGPPSVLAPGESVSFDGGASYGVGASVSSWTWSLESPPGALATLTSPHIPSRALLEPQGLGSHTVWLDVADTDGRVACAPTQHVVNVLLEEGLVVELWWETQGDPDPTDTGPGAGTDLDLHVLHELATGLDVDGDEVFDGWFDKPFDVFWGNQSPNWGVVGDPKAEDDPELVADDFDGAGPERMVLGSPEEDRAYRVGVHHWDAHGYGPATPWVRIWWQGELIHEAGGVALVEDDLWYVGTVGAEGVWTQPGPEPVIYPGVRKPLSLKAH